MQAFNAMALVEASPAYAHHHRAPACHRLLLALPAKADGARHASHIIAADSMRPIEQRRAHRHHGE